MLYIEKNEEIRLLLKKAEILLNCHHLIKAKACYEKILAIDPENAEAYTGLFVTSLKLVTEDTYNLNKESPSKKQI